MTIPRISSLLVMLALGQDALAAQMGQISSASVRGEPLVARVTLYGMSSPGDAEMRAELLPAFGVASDQFELLDMRSHIETDVSGVQTIVITSARPFDAARLALRVRLREGTRAVVRHFELNVPPAPAPRVSQAAPASRPLPARRPAPAVTRKLARTPTASSADAAGNYGPVRAGQSLWGILKETGLAGRNSAALMRDIVAANPHAFVDADPTRLRVGVTLQLPGAPRVAASAADSTNSRTLSPPQPQQVDAETAARIERLAVRFAQIRARYAEQQQRMAQRPSAPSGADGAAENAAVTIVAAPAATEPMPATEAANKKTDLTPQSASADKLEPVTAPREARATPQPTHSATPLDGLARYVDGKMLVGVGAALLVIALTLGVMRFGRRLRLRSADAGARSADREMVAEIARKTEQRVQLEGEVKRMIAGRRDTAHKPAPSALRPADLLSGVSASLEDIESRIAHGQYNEAESMLEQTIVATPNNHRAKLRLAEIYYLNERHEEFVDLAEEIHRQHRSDIGDENWARLMRMGKVIAPDRPPFSGPVAVEVGHRAH